MKREDLTEKLLDIKRRERLELEIHPGGNSAAIRTS